MRLSCCLQAETYMTLRKDIKVFCENRSVKLNLIITLKIIHYVALFLAGGAGVANPLLIKAHKSSGIPPSNEVQQTMLKLVKLSLLAMILIWISGLERGFAIYSFCLLISLILAKTRKKIGIMNTGNAIINIKG